MILARRIAEHFVAPAGGRAASATSAGDALDPDGIRAAPSTPPAVAVLAPAADAAALGAGLGLALVRGRRTRAAVVCVWSPDRARVSWRAPALPAAARLGAALAARGHAVRTAGRLVVVRLAEQPEHAAAEALRVGAAAGPAPAVLALGGPRLAAFDAVLAAQDLVVVALPPASDPALARLAVAGLERAITCEVPPADPARALAAAGVALLPSARRALSVPVAELS